MTSPKDERPELVARLRKIAPRRFEGRAPPVAALDMSGICMWELNELINQAADALEPQAGMVSEDEEEAYERGLRDGYQKAVQDIDMLTGGERLTPSEQGSVVRLREALEEARGALATALDWAEGCEPYDTRESKRKDADLKNVRKAIARIDALSIGGKNGPGQSDHEGGV